MSKVQSYEELFGDDSEAIESCVVCQEETSYWWSKGCMPLCPVCCKYMDFDSIYRLAREEEYGPLPKALTLGRRYYRW